MNVEFEAALRYIDLGETAKAEEHLIKVVEKAKDDVEEMQYRCVLGEFYANNGEKDKSREQFDKILSHEEHADQLRKQRAIARAYVDAFDGKVPVPEQEKRPRDIPIFPKPRQNANFIVKQSRKHR